MQKLPWKMFTASLLHIFSSSLELSRRGRQRGRQSARCGSSFFYFFPLGFRGEEIGKPRSKNWEIFHHFLNSCTWNYFASLTKALKCFQIVPGRRHRKCGVTTVFTYSHLNTPIDQWERAYYLQYFIINYIRSLWLTWRRVPAVFSISYKRMIARTTVSSQGIRTWTKIVAVVNTASTLVDICG